jgi:hypothetical protein
LAPPEKPLLLMLITQQILSYEVSLYSFNQQFVSAMLIKYSVDEANCSFKHLRSSLILKRNKIIIG